MQCRVAELTEFQDSFTGISSQFKGQTTRNYFVKPTFLPKNERTNSTLLLVDLLSFGFLEESENTKKTFRN